MRFSQQHKFIFIASPKTGTSSIHKFLDENFDNLEKWCVIKDGKSIKVRGHATALELRNVLKDEYDSYKKFAFIRNPYSKLLSSYFFLKKGGKQKTMGIKLTMKQRLIVGAKSFFVHLLPFKIWSIIYPYKSNYEYITDKNGELIIDYVGDFEKLENDLFSILDDIGLKNIDKSNFPFINKSGAYNYNHYFKSKWFKRIIDFKLRKDLKFYKSLTSVEKN